jgi:VWFA-related protein
MVRSFSILRAASLCAIAVCVSAATAQAPSAATPAKPETTTGPTTTLSLDARLVNLPVIVRDKKGAIIQNLTKDDFALAVDGHDATIRYFDKDNDLPLTLGLLVDISGSVRNTLDEERTASSAFLDQMLTAPAGRQPDRAFIMQFAQQAELLQDITPSRPKLQAALKEIGSTDPNASNRPSDPDDQNNGGGGPRRRGGGGGTALYDSVFLAADELLSKQKGRKAIILLTDGEDRGSRESLNRSIEAAQRADTIVYAIYFKGEDHGGGQQQDNRRGGGGGFPGGGGRGGGFPGGGGGYPGAGRPGGGGQQRPQETRVDGKKILERMVNETGGRVFEENKKQDFAAIYTQIAEELRSQYRLGFTPDQTNMEDGYHRVDLGLPKKKDLRIQTREGYYTGK